MTLVFAMCLVLLPLLMMASVTGFLIEHPCPTTPPCTCGSPDTNTIYCNSKQLTMFPVFTTTERTYSPDFKIYMQKNRITTIPDNAFLPLANMFSKSYMGSIDLSDNQIHTISFQAFFGIADRVYKMYLSRNNLTTMPAALTALTNVDTIQIDGNPISVIDSNTILAVGKTLIHFSIDMDHFGDWPVQLGLITKIFDLKLMKLPFKTIPSDAFRNWTRLGSLELSDSQLEEIPDALCELNSSFSFYFNKNINIKQTKLFPDCTNATGSLEKVRSVTLNSNNLQSISNTLGTFLNLDYLTITKNPRLHYINDEHVPDNHTLVNIVLDHNGFDRIPEALQKLNKLYSVDLSYNLITTIQRHDFDGFANLHVIKLQGNPLIYVSSEAFLSSVHLTTIYLQSTNLTQISQSIVGLQNLTQLDLSGSPIECTCDSMKYLNALVDRVYWYAPCNGTCVYINGLCTSQKNIGEYLKHTLSKC